MSDELVEGLRIAATFVELEPQRNSDAELMRRAAAEIERLQHDLTKAIGNHAADAAEMERLSACPRPLVMGEHACTNRKQCCEPCGDLCNHDEYQVAVARDESGKIIGTWKQDLTQDTLDIEPLI